MPFWSDLTPLGKQIVLGVLLVILLPVALVTKPWNTDVSSPGEQDSGQHTIAQASAEARIEPSPTPGAAPASAVPVQPTPAPAPEAAQPAPAPLATLSPQYAWSESLETARLMGRLMYSPA